MDVALREIVEMLPRYPLAIIGPSRAVSVPAEVPEGYVWPRVSYKSNETTGQVVLVSAPGAMGKTMAAEALAAAAGVLRFDLSQIRVGNGTLAGELGKSMGMSAAGAFMENLVAGSSAVIIDGLDEAQLQSGTENLFAFLQDVAELLKDAAPKSQVILLGRPDSISGASTVLVENRISVVETVLEPLDFESASRLIGNSLDRTGYVSHRTFVSPFIELLEYVFTDLGRALVGSGKSISQVWAEAGMFLGYPPVILAIARRLAVPNPHQELEKLREEGATSAMTRGGLLRQICEEILDREQVKVQQKVAGALGLQESDPKVAILYTREEQLVRLLDRSMAGNMMVIPPEALTPSEKERYEDLVSNFVVDHPFLIDRRYSSVVFSDYLRAFVSTSETIAAFGPSRAELVGSSPEVGPFLSHFIHALCGVVGDDVAVVSEDAVDGLLRSFQVEDSPGRLAAFVESDGIAHLLLAYGDGLASPTGPIKLLAFKVEDLSGVLEVTTPISHTSIITDAGLVIRSRSGVCEIGPSVILLSSEIELSGDRLFVIPPQAGEYGVTISFESVTHGPTMSISSPRPDALAVISQSRAHPWGQYVSEMPSGTSVVSSERLREGVIQVRRILTAFGRAQGESPARNKEMIDRLVVGASQTAQEIFSGLVSLGIIIEDGSLYRLDLDELADFGVSYGVLKGSQFGVALAPLVERIFEER
jgi:hypothetical protein